MVTNVGKAPAAQQIASTGLAGSNRVSRDLSWLSREGTACALEPLGVSRGERTLGNFRLARASCASDDGASELEGRTEGMLVLPWYGAGISRACAAYSGLMGAGM